MSEASKYRPDIDGLRAVAVLAVVAYHAAPGRLPGGFIGVDIFFVISGYLISSILLNSLQKDKFSILEFYERRIRRIFPALLLVLIACLLFGWFYLFAEDFKLLGKHVTGGAGFVSNILLWNESGYFDAAAETKPLLHLWSLGIEEQFYLFWPLFLWALWKVKKYIAVAIVGVLCFSFILNVASVETSPVSAFYSPFSRFWELMIGSVLAYITVNKSNDNKKITVIQQNVLSAFGLLAIVVGLFIINKERSFPGYWALMPTVGAAMLIHAGPSSFINKYVLSNRLFIWFGLISYPLYLWHWPLLVFPKIVIGELSQPVKLLLVLVSIGLAWLTYQYIEKPVRRCSSPRALAISLAFSMLALAVIGFGIFKSDGFVGHGVRKAGTQQFLDYFENSMPVMAYFKRNSIQEKFREECNFYDMANRVRGEHTLVPIHEIAPSCYIRNYERSKAVLIWGDSHAQMLSYGLANNLPKDWQLLQVASSGCAASIEMTGNEKLDYCLKSNRFAMNTIEKERPDVVIIGQIYGHSIPKIYAIEQKLKEFGVKKVIFTGPSPHWRPHLPNVIVRNLWPNVPIRTFVGIDRDILNLNKRLSDEFRNSPRVNYVDIIALFCNSSGCLTRIGNDTKSGITTWDYGHLTPIASEYLANKILSNEVQSEN